MLMQRTKGALRAVVGSVLEAATLFEPVSLLLVLRLPFLFWLPRYLLWKVFSAPALVAPPVLVLVPSFFISWPFCFSSSLICVSCLFICVYCFLTTFNRSSFCVVICCMCSLSAVAATATSRQFFARRCSPLYSSALAELSNP